MSLSREELSLVEKIASRVSRGQSSQQIAIEADLDVNYVDKVIALPVFEETFKSIDPKGYQKWVDNQADLVTKRQVMTMAREDSKDFYKQARDIIRGSKELKDKERLDAIFAILKIAKIGEGESVQEVVMMSQDNLDTILEAWNETE